MDALLILSALLLTFLGLTWLAIRGFSTSLLWGWVALLPGFNLLFVFAHWRRAAQPVGLCALALIPLLTGLVLIAHQDPQRLQAIIELQWLHQAPAELSGMKLKGQLNGELFSPQQGEFLDGVLSLRDGEQTYLQRELLIRGLPLGKQALAMDVLPTDQGPLPEVEISWLAADQGFPQTRRLAAGYSLHLDLQPVADGRLLGDLHLIMPTSFKTSLSGQVEVLRSGLAFREGRIDRHLDSHDTLAYVLDDYLQRRFVTADVQLGRLPPLELPAKAIDLEFVARVKGQPQRVSLRLNKDKHTGWLVQGDNYPALGSELGGAEPDNPVPGHAQSLAKAADFSLLMLLSDTQRYLDQSLRIHSNSGVLAQGRFLGINEEGMIVLHQRLVGAGEAHFTVSPERISHVELIEP